MTSATPRSDDGQGGGGAATPRTGGSQEAPGPEAGWTGGSQGAPGPGAGWVVEGSAGRGWIDPDEADRAARAYWEGEADAYQAEHGRFLAGSRALVVDSDHPVDGIDYQRTAQDAPSAAFVWGPEGLTEAEAGLLGPAGELAGCHVLEVGCGAAQCSAWLARQGAHAIGVDISVNQLRHAMRATHPAGRPRRPSHADDPNDPSDPGDPTPVGERSRTTRAGRGSLHAVAATATALPFREASFDHAFASYGAPQFVADLPRLFAEVRRVLRPGGRWVFSVTHPIRWAFPDDPGAAGLRATGSYFDRAPYVERDGAGTAAYAEFHRTIGDYVAALRLAGFTLEAMREPEWPAWNDAVWGGWSPLRGAHLPGTLIIGCRADAAVN